MVSSQAKAGQGKDDISVNGTVPSIQPPFESGALLDKNMPVVAAPRPVAYADAFLPVLSELSSLSNIAYAPVRSTKKNKKKLWLHHRVLFLRSVATANRLGA